MHSSSYYIKRNFLENVSMVIIYSDSLLFAELLIRTFTKYHYLFRTVNIKCLWRLKLCVDYDGWANCDDFSRKLFSFPSYTERIEKKRNKISELTLDFVEIHSTESNFFFFLTQNIQPKRANYRNRSSKTAHSSCSCA